MVRRSPSGGALTALAVIPAVCAALIGVIAVAVTVHASHQSQLLSGTTLTVVAVLAVLLVVVVVVGYTWASRLARSASTPVAEYGYVATAVHAPAATSVAVTPAAATLGASAAIPPTADKGVFVHLSHRLQSLVHRQIQLLDELENDVEEPDLLKGLFGVDHLATRMRRHAENLAVLGGAVPRRQWTKPVSVMEVLRSAVSETLDYARVQVIARTPGSLNGYAVADVIHLLAELVENATSFSPPETRVVLRTQAVAAGLAIEIDDRGLGMSQHEYDRLNALLREPAQISVQELLEGARIGLYVVAQLSRRHGIAVHLQTNITGGTQALVVLPKAVLAAEPRQLTAAPPAPPNPAPAPAPPVAAVAPAPAAAVPAPAVYAAAPVSEHSEPRQPVESTPIAVRSTDYDGMSQAPRPGTAPAPARPVYGVDGVLPAPRRPVNGTAPVPTVGRPAERNLPAQLDQRASGPAASPVVGRPASYDDGVSGPTSAPTVDRPRSYDPEPPESASSGAAAPSDTGPRRPLPRRRPQEHLAAPLAQASSDPADLVGEGLMPNMMADFKRGLSLGATEPGRPEPTREQAPNQEGER